MPRFEKVPEEAARQWGRRGVPSLDLSEYRAFLEELQPGEWGRITLAEGESQRAVKRRLTMAAKDLDKLLRYRRAPEGQILVGVKALFHYPAPTASSEVSST